MASYLEVWKPDGPELVPLDGERVTIGSHDSNDVVLSADRTVSRLHAVLEEFPAGWSLRDMGSRNGTFVNGQKLMGERVLGPGDEVRIGRTRLVVRGGGHGEHTATEAAQPPPAALMRRTRRPSMYSMRRWPDGPAATMFFGFPMPMMLVVSARRRNPSPAHLLGGTAEGDPYLPVRS